MLSLNMMDIARKRGIEIDVERLSRELGMPVVASVAVRRGGTDALLAEIDRRLDAQPGDASRPTGARPTPAPCAAASARPTACCARRSARPASATAARRRLDAVLLHPVAGLVDPARPPVRDVPGGVRLGAAADGR